MMPPNRDSRLSHIDKSEIGVVGVAPSQLLGLGQVFGIQHKSLDRAGLLLARFGVAERDGESLKHGIKLALTAGFDQATSASSLRIREQSMSRTTL